jgi:hypothetical protein
MKLLMCNIVFMPTHVYSGTEFMMGSASRRLFFSTGVIEGLVLSAKIPTNTPSNEVLKHTE